MLPAWRVLQTRLSPCAHRAVYEPHWGGGSWLGVAPAVSPLGSVQAVQGTRQPMWPWFSLAKRECWSHLPMSSCPWCRPPGAGWQWSSHGCAGVTVGEGCDSGPCWAAGQKTQGCGHACCSSPHSLGAPSWKRCWHVQSSPCPFLCLLGSREAGLGGATPAWVTEMPMSATMLGPGFLGVSGDRAHFLGPTVTSHRALGHLGPKPIY